MKRHPFRIVEPAADSLLCGCAALAGSGYQSLRRYHEAVKPVHHAAALGAADNTDVGSDRFRPDMGNIELLKPERVGHFFYIAHDFPCEDARKLTSTILAVTALNRHATIAIPTSVAEAPRSLKYLDTVFPNFAELGTFREVPRCAA